MNHFFIRLWPVMQSGFYDNWWWLVQWLNWEAPKHFPKPNLYQKRFMVTVSLIHYSFLNSSEIITSEKYTQQINEMHQKLQCLRLAFVNKKGPILLHDKAQLHVAQPTLQKLNELGYKVLPHLPYLLGLSPTNYHFFKHLDNFLNQQKAENAFREFVKS